MRSLIMVTLLTVALVNPALVQAKAAQGRKSRKPATAKAAPSEKIAEQFQTFCRDWMQKLAVRERDNMSNIKWNTKSDGVEGEYVGYTTDHTCTVMGDGNEPVGKLTYEEIRYTKRGRTIADAQNSTPQPVETTAVTELFRYEKGKWIY